MNKKDKINMVMEIRHNLSNVLTKIKKKKNIIQEASIM